MKAFLLTVFTWWNSQTFATAMYTKIRGEMVGEDIYGNMYFQHKKNVKKRWVIYKGIAEPSLVPALWHSWLHQVTDIVPTAQDIKKNQWQKPHLPNLTGTDLAYKPSGSLGFSRMRRQKSGADYEAWRP